MKCPGNVRLTKHGRLQAQEIAARLGGKPISLIATSALSRSVRTAVPLAKALGLEPQQGSESPFSKSGIEPDACCRAWRRNGCQGGPTSHSLDIFGSTA
ncbi:histidine phosphatase family protein [Silicimonas sp. MF1-12-2]|uniref:histidine phosphatase family protein n=1 Tax=Silicimonas sp. MF1-12-2 TaxID=3384793 RepID=UPI0039B6135D